MTRRILVTGAGGFVGRAAVPALRARGYEVHGAARRRADGVALDAWHSVDLLEPSAPRAVVRAARPSHLLHLAWTTAPGRYWTDPANLAWVRSSLALVEAFAEAGGRRAVFGGSCAQYDWGDAALGSEGVASEAVTPRRPATLYGRAKQATSDLLETWAPSAGLSAATALLFFPYGPCEPPERLVPTVVRALLAGEPAPLTAGTQVRDLLHVSDCGAALAALVDADVTGAVNVGSGVGVSIAEVARTVARLFGREDLLRLGALPAREEPPRLVADPSRLRDEVGFEPRYELESGLAAAVAWWRGPRATVSERGGDTRPARR